MHILVVASQPQGPQIRVAVVIAGTATGSDLKDKVGKQSGLDASAMTLRLRGDELADEMSEESFPSSDPPSTWVGESTPADD